VKLKDALTSSNAKERFAAVKKIARDKDVTYLKTLSKMAAHDPDEQVREVAAKAVAHIKSAGRAVGEAQKPREVVVSARDEARAKNFLDAGIGYQINGERDRALKELAKALKANPKLERDQFFRSVLEEITGLHADEAMGLVRSPDQLKAVEESERQYKQDKRKQAHQDEVSRSRWASVLMDLAIYAFLSIVLTILGLGLTGQSAQSFLIRHAETMQRFESGELDELPEFDPLFVEYAGQLTFLTIPTSVVAGLITGAASVVSLLVNLFFTHLAARFIFGGQATLPHLIYTVVSFYNTRLPILYGLMFVTIVLMFAVGGGIIPFIGGGAISLYSLLLFFKTIGRIGQAYDFGTGKGCLSFLAGSIIVGIIGFVIQLLFIGSIMAMIASQMALNGAG
jgi:hypothetical protein